MAGYVQVSPFDPSSLPHMPVIPGARFAAAAAGLRKGAKIEYIDPALQPQQPPKPQ